MSRGTSRAAAVVLAVAGGILLFFFDPASSRFFPPCLLRLATGFACPGCGSLRAMHELLHGHVAAAFVLNPLLVVALPVAIALEVWPRLTRKPLDLPPSAGAILAAAVVTFWVLRNLPGVAVLGP